MDTNSHESRRESKRSEDLREGRKGRPRDEFRAQSSADRLPPHSIEAEQGVLGCVFLAPKECLPECRAQFKAGHLVFYDLKHQVIYELLCVMEDEGEAIDLITVKQRLDKRGGLEQVGGIGYVAALPDKVPSAANLSFYISIVREKHQLRSMLREAALFTETVYSTEDRTAEQVLNDFEASVLEVNRAHLVSRTPSIKEIVCRVADNIANKHRRGVGMITGIGTGLSFFDKLTGGLQMTELSLWCARPSGGKSSIVFNIAEFASVQGGIPAWAACAESCAETVVFRMMCARSRLDSRDFRTGFKRDADEVRMFKAAQEIAVAPLVIDDLTSPPVETVVAKLRRWTYERQDAWAKANHKEEDFKALAVIDYAQLLTTTNRDVQRAGSRDVNTHIARQLQKAARDLKIHIAAAAQLVRGQQQKGKNPKPTQSDIAESDEYTRAADVICLLHYDDPEDDEELNEWRKSMEWPVTLLLEKQRNGETGPVELMFYKRFTKFEDRHRPSNAPQDEQELDNRRGAEAQSGGEGLPTTEEMGL